MASLTGAAATGLAAALALWLAWRRRWLTRAGLVSAVAVGAGTWSGGGSAAVAALLFFFVTASALSATGPHRRHPGPRDAIQVWANGGWAAAAGVAGALGWLPGAPYAAVGALAAATADTWASEVGRRAGGVTYHALTGRRLEPGRPGGISAAGTAAGAAGALAVAGVAVLAGASGAALRWLGAGLAAGAGGMTLDSAIRAALASGSGEEDPGSGSPQGAGAGRAAGHLANAAATLAGAALGWWLGRGG